MSTAPIDPYQGVPTTVVYDTFAETATRLTGRYTRLSDTATSDEERDRWWQKVLELRDTKRNVPAHDRAQLIAWIAEWEAELARLSDARG
ncbi:hypothetical protein [Streptomyces naphthomycinicus]|uniref:hypothetical protein n=1 Tax=Streptomyces naphthomycinicus TaxID=2872625 RepID=UPI001CEDCAAA|nr:hypothetical protein [Streptomyces sp. TML10]